MTTPPVIASVQVSAARVININNTNGSSTFLGLSDTPASFSGAATYLLRVNVAGTAVEFVDPADYGGGGISDAPDTGYYVRTIGNWIDLSSFGFLTAIDANDVMTALGYTPQDSSTAFSGNYSDLDGVPNSFTPTPHNHAIADITNLQSSLNSKENSVASGTASQYYRGDKSWQTLDKIAVGLSNIDNTSDANKPISSATQTALDSKQNNLVPGTNIKTINNTSLLGSGNIDITGGGATIPSPKTVTTSTYAVLAGDHLGTIYFTYNGTVTVDFDDTLIEPFQVDLVVDSASTTITTTASGIRTIEGALSVTGLDSALSVRLKGTKYYSLGGGEANIGENLGSGEGLYIANNNGALQFKSLVAGSGIEFVVSGDSITISTNGVPEFTYPAVLNTYFTNASITNSIYKDQLYDLYLFLTGATDSGARSGASWTQLSSNLWTQTLGLWVSHSNYNAISGLIYDFSANAKNLTAFGSITRTGGLWTYSTGGGYISADSVIPDKASGSYGAYVIANFAGQPANTGALGIYRNPGTGRATLLAFTAADDFATVFHNNGTSTALQYNVGDLNQATNQGLGVIDCGANNLIYYANGSTTAANTVAVTGGINLTGTHWLCVGANQSASTPPTVPVALAGTGVGQMPIAIIFNTNPSAENAKIKAAINSIFGWSY